MRAGVWSWAGPVIQGQHKTGRPAPAAESKSAPAIFFPDSKHNPRLKSRLKLRRNNTKTGFASALKGKSTDFAVMRNKEDKDESECT